MDRGMAQRRGRFQVDWLCIGCSRLPPGAARGRTKLCRRAGDKPAVAAARRGGCVGATAGTTGTPAILPNRVRRACAPVNSGREVACFTARTRAPASSGNVTMEISHRSTAMQPAHPRARIDLPLTVRKPIDSPSTAPARSSDSSSRARATSGISRPRARKPARILAQFEPDADRLGRIVLEQHRDAVHAARGERRGESAAHHHVARLVDLAEQAGIAFHRAVGVDGGARREHGGNGGFVSWVRAWLASSARTSPSPPGLDPGVHEKARHLPNCRMDGRGTAF